MAQRKVPAVAYLRTSSAANVGADKDSDKRQAATIAAFAKQARFEIVDTFYDAAVSGADPIETRPGFAALLDRIEGNGVKTVIVEDASRFARELMAQELGVSLLIARKVRLLTALGDDLTASDDPTRKMMRQIAGAFAEYEKARLVGKLKQARDRKRRETGKCEGRKSRAEQLRSRLLKDIRVDCNAFNEVQAAAIRVSLPTDLASQLPDDLSHGVSHDLANRLADAVEARMVEAMAMAKRLRRANPKTGERLSLRRIAKRLADDGLLNERGVEYNPNAIRRMTEAR